MDPLKETVISSHTTNNVLAARESAMDAIARSQAALDSHASFFNDDHMRRVHAVTTIVDSFFPVKHQVYVNHRSGRGRPFTTVKVSHIGRWPANADKQRDLYQPLAALGVSEVKLTSSSNSYLFRMF